jgi:hypothetical protein
MIAAIGVPNTVVMPAAAPATSKVFRSLSLTGSICAISEPMAPPVMMIGPSAPNGQAKRRLTKIQVSQSEASEIGQIGAQSDQTQQNEAARYPAAANNHRDRRTHQHAGIPWPIAFVILDLAHKFSHIYRVTI